MHDLNLYKELGEDGLTQLVAAFYKQIPSDDILGPMYPEDDWEGAEKRLRDFLIFRFGGPARYIEERGHPRLRMRHMPFAINQAARDRWMQLMSKALDDQGLSGELREKLEGFLSHVATFLINRRAH